MKRLGSQKPVVRLMLDSGAFSAYVQNKHIALDDYIEYVKEHKPELDSYFNLDVIPGKYPHKRKPGEADIGAKLSRQNFLKMRKAGLRPIPVFHQEEDYKWLDLMFEDIRTDENPYLALSTLKELSIEENRDWLDVCFTKLTDSSGKPLVRIHGLGIGSWDLIKRYPWFSVDATSWALTAAYGSIFVPKYAGGKPDYTQAPIKLTVSDQGKKDGLLGSDHYKRMGPIMQERVKHFLEKEVGVKVEHAAKDHGDLKAYEVRARAIVYFYMRFAEAIGNQPFRYRKRGFI